MYELLPSSASVLATAKDGVAYMYGLLPSAEQVSSVGRQIVANASSAANKLVCTTGYGLKTVGGIAEMAGTTIEVASKVVEPTGKVVAWLAGRALGENVESVGNSVAKASGEFVNFVGKAIYTTGTFVSRAGGVAVDVFA